MKEKIIEIQETFGMTQKKVAEILQLSHGTFRNYMNNEPYRIDEGHVNRLIEYIKSESDKLKKC